MRKAVIKGIWITRLMWGIFTLKACSKECCVSFLIDKNRCPWYLTSIVVFWWWQCLQILSEINYWMAWKYLTIMLCCLISGLDKDWQGKKKKAFFSIAKRKGNALCLCINVCSTLLITLNVILNNQAYFFQNNQLKCSYVVVKLTRLSAQCLSQSFSS